MQSKKKSLEIETLRGLACLLLVIYHVIGPLGGGLKIEMGSPYRALADSMVYIRMPLFVFISGYIYSIYKIRGNDFAAYLTGKVRRLIVPLFFVGIPFSILQAIGPGVNKDLSLMDALMSFYVPVNHFWFLQAVFIIFVFVGLLQWLAMLQTAMRLYLLLLISAVAFLMPAFSIDAFGVNGAIYLLPFFITGMICHENRDVLKLKPKVVGPSIFALIFLSLLYIAATNRELIIDRRSFVGLVVGCISCVTLFLSNTHSKPLVWLGNYSYSIFLYHILFAASSRLALNRLGVSDNSVLILSGVVIGLWGPVILSNFLSRHSITSLLFLGERTLKQNNSEIELQISRS